MKSKNFVLTLKDGTQKEVRAPHAVTLEYANKVAYHWGRVDKNDVIKVEIIY